MNKNILISKLNDKYYIKYKIFINYLYKKYDYINQNILYNYVFIGVKQLCNYKYLRSIFEQYYMNIIFHNTINNNIGKIINIQHYILIKYYNEIKNFKKLIISNIISVVTNIYNVISNTTNIDTILLYNNKNKFPDLLKYPVSINLIKPKNINIYSSFDINIYKQFLINLKNNNETNNILIPKYKYDFISCHVGYISLLGIMSSYRMTLEIPNIISTISMSLKCLKKDGTLLLFWTIVNVNIPVIKKILSLLTYGFKNVEIIDNDINQNLLIGVPEYYIKCSEYKDNITHDLINKLLDIAIDTVEKYNYDICDVLDYYEDYTEKNPNHSLFYNKIDDTEPKKESISKKSPKTIEKPKEINPIYYIEDINIPELDDIMKDSEIQFKVSILANKLEGIFVGYFEMVNNYILNAIDTDSKGDYFVKPQAIKQKDITNLTKLINMFEYNKLPYNKHALSALLEKKDEYTDYIYGLTNTIDNTLVKYKDSNTIKLNTSALEHFALSKPYTTDGYTNYIDKVSISNKVKVKLLEDIKSNDKDNKNTKDRKEIEFEEFEKENDILEKLTKGLSAYIKLDVTPDKIPITVKDFLSLASTIKTNLGINEFAINNTNEYKVGFIVRENNKILYDHDEKVNNNKNVLVHDILSKELKKLNIPFKTTNFDNATFEEQADFLKDVKILIACHGTAFTNLFLLPKNASIMEVSFRKYWYCDPVCECHYSGKCAYKTDCHNRNKVINKSRFDEKKNKLIYHKAEYYNLSQLFGIGYKEILIEDANGYFNDTTTSDLNNPLNLTNIYIDTNAIITKINKLF
jgi:hypothetical protein